MKNDDWGPKLPISEEIHSQKYRGDGESFSESCARFAHTLADSAEHFRQVYNILLDMRFLGGGRTQAAVGAPRTVTAFNCFVSGTIKDSMDDIMAKAAESAQTMRLGGGIGYDFSTLRPRGDRIVSLDSRSSGPISFMDIFNSVCNTISSAGHRRGAQMGVLRVDHPDIEEFIRAKQNNDKLKAFNISVGITDEFMQAVIDDAEFSLRFAGRTYQTIRAAALWEEIMRSTWDWAEPGVLFIDRINEYNNLYYCETIAATNPCGEQPLPPYGACLLGSFNLVKYLKDHDNDGRVTRYFDFDQLRTDIPAVVRAMDNIHDTTTFPLDAQREESQVKRRMGLGITGAANAGEILGYEYGTEGFNQWLQEVLTIIRDCVYGASVDLAKEKGPFPLFDADLYLQGKFIRTLPQNLRRRIRRNGIRNSHLLSIAPTGTISLAADNISSGIEPVFSHFYDRTIQAFDGAKTERVTDYAYRTYGIEGKTASQCTPQEHLSVLALAQQYVDSACSKTINLDATTSWEDFKEIYLTAWRLGCKGCTTFNKDGKRGGILVDAPNTSEETGGKACFIDPVTGQPECS
jgi:ribonucleoside-diphosphate reductase alpha chain